MSRIRSIKPDFWTSEQILECSRNARLLFIGLWNFCDDAGRHPYSAKQAKAEVFPADDLSETEITAMLEELIKSDLIRLYDFEGKRFFYVTGWKHQRIDKPQSAKYPDPLSEHSRNVRGTLPPDRIGEDRIGREEDTAVAVLPTILKTGEPLEIENLVTGPPVLPSPEVPKEQPGKYAFEAGVIRLNKRDFQDWLESFSSLDLRAELHGLQQWAGRQPDWFFAVKGALAKKNRDQKVKLEQARAAGPPSKRHTIADPMAGII